MADKSWKARERRVCRLLGCQRRGADFGGVEGGKNDCMDGCAYSVEIKSWASPPSFRVMCEEVDKAVVRATALQIPVAVVYEKGMDDLDGLVIMRMRNFLEWFANPTSGEEK